MKMCVWSLKGGADAILFGLEAIYINKIQITPSTKEKMHTFLYIKSKNFWDFPGGAVVKNQPANAEDTGSIPGLGRSHMPRSS